MRRALLDVNLLVALFDADHVHHELAHDWFADNRAGGWATCPITENGLIRVLTDPAYASTVSTASAIVQRLQAFRASGDHDFWPDDFSVTDDRLVRPTLVRGHRQLTDIYLLALACRHGGRLATLDRGIPLSAVPGASKDALAVIAPID